MDVRAVSNIGRRKINEDSYWVATLKVDDSEAGIICVCDGMGGLAEGDYASAFVVNSLRDVILSDPGTINPDSIVSALKKANSELYDRGKTQSAKLGTTCTLVIAIEGQYRLLHIGDSRCYHLFRDTTYRVLTKDHTAYQKFVDEKSIEVIGPGSFRVRGKEIDKRGLARYRSQLTKCIGVRESCELDIIEGKYSPGDVFLVGSDGFWHYLDRRDKWAVDLRQSFSRPSTGVEDNLELVMSWNTAMFQELDNMTAAAMKV